MESPNSPNPFDPADSPDPLPPEPTRSFDLASDSIVNDGSSGFAAHASDKQRNQRDQQKITDQQLPIPTGQTADEAEEERELTPGDVLDGRYEIISLIGVGGMGEVYKARHLAINRMVAIKVLHQMHVSKRRTIARFQQEARAASKISHTNVVTVTDFGATERALPYLVMDYVEGRTLDQVLSTDGPLSRRRALNIFVQACSGLAEAHRHGIIHRDLKPSNIMLVNEGTDKETVKIVDFGIAKIADEDSSLELTKTGDVFGSPLYMSPEQCQGKPLDLRSDIYSIGCVMYEALTGRLPFMGATIFETISRHVNEMPPRLFDKGFHGIEPIVLKTLAKEPDQRHQSMAELVKDLNTLEESTRWREILGTCLKMFTLQLNFRWRRQWKLVLVAAAALVVCTVLGISYLSYSPALDLPETVWLSPPTTFSRPTDQEEDRLKSALWIYRQFLKRVPHDQPLIEMQMRLANTYLSWGQFENARVYLNEAAKLMAVSPEAVNFSALDRERLYERLGDANYFLGDYAEAQRAYAIATPLMQNISFEPGERPALFYMRMGECYLRLGEFDRAERALLQAKNDWAISDRDCTDRMHVYSLSLLADVYRLESKHRIQQSWAQAESHYRAASQGWYKIEGDTGVNLAISNFYLGQCLQRDGDNQRALNLYRDALPVLKSRFGSKSDLYRYALSRYGDVLWACGRYVESLQVRLELRS